jgi:ubiquinone/menaquinone biosynthesis C-methylase UbiE
VPIAEAQASIFSVPFGESRCILNIYLQLRSSRMRFNSGIPLVLESGLHGATDFLRVLVMNDIYDEGLARQQEELAATADMVAQRKAMLGLLNLNAGEHVLDVGSGNGIFVRDVLEIVGSNGHACGIDISEIMVGMAQNICPGAAFVKGDATDLPVDDESYDVLTTSQLLCFVHDIPGALREFYRVLKPGGRMLILDTDWESLIWNCRNQALMSRAVKLFTSPLVNLYTPRSLSRQITETGFELLDRQSFSVINWERDPNSYSEQCAGFIRQMMESSPDFSPEDWESWDSDLREIDAADEYLFSLNRYLFAARKA